MTKNQPQRITIRTGYRHPTLGEIGGWNATVLRTFTVRSVLYCDIEFSVSTIENIRDTDKKKFYNKKIVFTRARIAEQDTLPVSQNIPMEKKYAVSAKIQKEWYDLVGIDETDPTQFAADKAYSEDHDEQRREAMKTLVKVGAFTLLFTYIICKKEEEDEENSNWGRGGRHYS